ncbi:TauD/TfdA dioxygenase family protein [Streptosporangium sp. NPDC003464]
MNALILNEPGRAQIGPRTLRRLPEGWPRRPCERLQICPVGPLIGAEITGVDLGAPLDEELKAELREALLEWKVIFFRGQRMTSADQRRLAEVWGRVETFPFLSKGGSPDVVRFAKHEERPGLENTWHSDATWHPTPSMGAVLRAVEVPVGGGGDTIWSDVAAAYDNLDPELAALADGREAVHHFDWLYSRLGLLEGEALDRARADFPPVRHPIVRTHPVTERRGIFVNRVFTEGVVGLEPGAARDLIDRLCRHVETPEYQVRFRWEPGSVAVWDNRATQHYAVNDYYPERRVMERISIVGDRPR